MDYLGLLAEIAKRGHKSGVVRLGVDTIIVSDALFVLVEQRAAATWWRPD